MADFDDILGEMEDLSDVNMIINHVAFIEDHSGSMGGSEKFAMEQYNEQLGEIKEKTKGQKTYFTKVSFSDFVNFDVEDKPVEEVEKSTEYPVYSSTRLFDAIGMTINRLEANMRKHPSDNQAALVIVITDGQENDSREFDGKKLKARVEELEANGNWTFTILGADFDIFKEMENKVNFAKGSTMRSNTLNFQKSAAGYSMSNTMLKRGVANYFSARATGQMNVANLYEEPKTDDEEDDENDNCDDACTWDSNTSNSR